MRSRPASGAASMPYRSRRSSSRACRCNCTVAIDRSPCFHAFIRDRALPCGVRGPVASFHGFTR